MSADEQRETCHHVRNGLVVIKALCYQIRRGTMSQEEGLGKIEHRCREIEKALDSGFRRNDEGGEAA